MLSILDLGMGESQTASAKRMYNIRGAHYDDSWHPHFARKLVSMANLKPGEHVLDLACGTGLATFEAARLVGSEGSVTGVDVSEGMLMVAEEKQRHIGEQIQNVQLYLHDITDLDAMEEVKGKTFDAITVASALVLLRDAPGAVKQWTRYLKPGGRLVIDVPHERNGISGKLLELVGDQLSIQVPYVRSWVKDQSSLRDVLQEAGLVVEIEDFVEQAGYGKRFYLPDDADDNFVSHLMTESGRIFRMPTERREEALKLFKQEWEKWSVDGKLEEVDGVYVAVARKPS